MPVIEDRLKLPIQPTHRFTPTPVHGRLNPDRLESGVTPVHKTESKVIEERLNLGIIPAHWSESQISWNNTKIYMEKGVQYFPFLLLALLLFYQAFGEKATYQMVLVVFISTLVMRINELDSLLKEGK